MRSPYLVVVCLLLSSCASRPKAIDAPIGDTPVDGAQAEAAVAAATEAAASTPTDAATPIATAAEPIDAVVRESPSAVAVAVGDAPAAVAITAPVTLGMSRGGRPIEALTINPGLGMGAGTGTGGITLASASPASPSSPPFANEADLTRVYLIGCIHGDEIEGLTSLDDVLLAIVPATIPNPAARFGTLFAPDLSAPAVPSPPPPLSSGSGTIVRLVRDMNPDGSHARTRANTSGIDLNRNWPASNFKAGKSTGPSPLCEPEAAAVHADIVQFDPHVIVVLHSSRSGPFVNYDGPEAAVNLAAVFADAAQAAGDPRWRLVPDMGYPTPGSMGSYFGKDRGVPILTIELRRGDPASKVLAPLTAGLTAVFTDRSMSLPPLSRAKGQPAAEAVAKNPIALPAASEPAE